MDDPHQEPPGYKPPKSAKELLERYAKGERWFVGANLRSADLRWTGLHRAILRRADFGGAVLSSVDFRCADLRGADFIAAHLNGVHLMQARLGGALLNSTNLTGLDLTPLCEASPSVRHTGPSKVDHVSVMLSIRSPRLKEFLVRAGMPSYLADIMIEYAKAAKGSIFAMMRSTFLSYGAPDEAFAKKLYEALHKNGVTTFLFSEHAEPGKRLHRMMREGVNEHDRVVLICSKASLDRKGVMNELEETLAREARDGGETYLIPIRLDDYVFNGWAPKREDIAQAVRDRVVADFEGAEKDDATFEAALSRLLRALRKKTVL